MGYIYLIENDYNNEKYVGMTTRTVEKRWKEHLRHSSQAIDAAIALHGAEHFKISILEECSEEDLDDREIYWINFYNSYYKGYNCTFGGRQNQTTIQKPQPYQQVKQLWDQGLLQKEIAEQLNIRPNTVHNYLIRNGITQEEINARKKQSVSNNKSKPVLQYDLNNNFIKEWKSATEAATTLNLNRRNISAVCAGTRKTCGNYIWRYKQ